MILLQNIYQTAAGTVCQMPLLIGSFFLNRGFSEEDEQPITKTAATAAGISAIMFRSIQSGANTLFSPISLFSLSGCVEELAERIQNRYIGKKFAQLISASATAIVAPTIGKCAVLGIKSFARTAWSGVKLGASYLQKLPISSGSMVGGLLGYEWSPHPRIPKEISAMAGMVIGLGVEKALSHPNLLGRAIEVIGSVLDQSLDGAAVCMGLSTLYLFTALLPKAVSNEEERRG